MPALSWSTCGRIGTTVRPAHAGRGAELQAALRPRRGPGLRAGEAGVIPMRMESVEAMEFLSEQVHKRPRPPAPKMQLHLTAARRPSSPT